MEILGKRVRINQIPGCVYQRASGVIVGKVQEDPPLYAFQPDQLDPRCPFHTIYAPTEFTVEDHGGDE